MKNIESFITKLLESVLTIIFFIIVVLTILLVILRYIFNSGITGGNELMEYLFVYTTVIGAAISIGKNEHIRIGLLTEKDNPVLKIITKLFGILCVILINIVFMYLSYSWISKVGDSPSPVLRIPMKCVQLSVPIGCVLSIIYCFFNLIKLFDKTGGEETKWQSSL
ncbi:MAG: TRAP transporter small permease [Spirochaetales bacterium]|nr:TRAP transporter small permease [Spirochaetales bacterium]